MFRLLSTTKRKRQQIAILIISFFTYVAGIRNEDNNMLLQQQHPYHTTIENSNYKSPADPLTYIRQQTTSNFRPSPIIDFTTADVAAPPHFQSTYYMDGKYPTTNTAATFSRNTSQQIFDKQNDNRRYTKTTYGNTMTEKQFSFASNEQQQQQPQQLTDRPIYIYRDPYTNENYHYKPTEPIITQDTSTPSLQTYNNYNYNGNGYKQQEHNNQEYLVQSSMVVGTQQQQQQHPYMSLSNDKDVYLKRPGLVYDEKTNYEHPNLVTIDKKSGEGQTVKANKISYDSHDYPPPSYFQQQTSNFLPTPVPEIAKPKPTTRPSPPPPPPRQQYRPPAMATSSMPQFFGQQHQQTSQTTLPNYANNIDNYLSNKQQFDYYHRETPQHTYLQQQQQQYESVPSYGSQHQQQYESRPPPTSYTQQYETEPPFYQQQQQQHYESKPPPPSYQQYQQQQQQYETRPPTSHNQVIPQQTYYPQQQQQQQPPGRPPYNNYYDYQIGEVPPQTQTSLPSSQNFNNPYQTRPPPGQFTQQGGYRPPQVAPPQQQSGLATLAQYAPQFTSLLLGGGGASSSSNTNSPLGSLIGALTGATTSQQPSYTSSSPSSSSSYNRKPVNSQLIKALENIARNDDLQCVPKVLCQMIAAQTQRGQLPTFITSPAITNFLAGFPAASPALIYGRGALLGLSGGEKSCHQAYVKCPKNELEIIYYLNNHRGGFFKFFSEPEEQQQNGNYESTQQGASSLFSILAALTGTPPVTTTTPRPKPKPQAPSTDITGGIGNFFTQLLSDYMGGASVEYQRRRKRRTKRSLDKIIFEEEINKDLVKFNEETYKDKDNENDEEDFNDEEDNEDTQQGMKFRDESENDDDENDLDLGTEGRILHKAGVRGKQVKFFPETKEISNENNNDQELKNIIKNYNDFNKGRKFKFPQDIRQGKGLTDAPYQDHNYGHQYTNYVEESYDPLVHRDLKKVKFQDDTEEQEQNLYADYQQLTQDVKTNVKFPERMGKIINYPDYAASYTYNGQQTDQFILPNNQRPSRFTEFPQTSSANVYNTHINSILSQNSFSSSSSINNNNIYNLYSKPNANNNNQPFLPTPTPDTDDSAANFLYSNSNDYNSNEQNLNSQYQSIYNKPQRYPSSASNNIYQSQYTNNDRYHSSLYTTRRPYTTTRTTKKADDKNIYITNSRGETEYYLTPDGRKIYL